MGLKKSIVVLQPTGYRHCNRVAFTGRNDVVLSLYEYLNNYYLNPTIPTCNHLLQYQKSDRMMRNLRYTGLSIIGEKNSGITKRNVIIFP